jgi:alginate O-acetyltransferase complex protein AlgI
MRVVFNSSIFLLAFLPIVFTLFWVARGKAARYVILAVSGYVFYGWWDWRFCGLLLFSSLVSYGVALLIARATGPAARRGWMVLAVAVDLSILGFFKYYNFFAGSVNALAGHAVAPWLHVVLPIGISFYTFHTISYICDTAAGRVTPTRNLWEYLAYVSLFSQLVAGPIVRYRQIEDDLEAIDGPPREDYIARGVGLFVAGLAKKVLVADTLAHFVDPLLSNVAGLSLPGAWCAALGYAFQLYFDFSGYSDMAMGLGYLFGLRIPANFNSPYTAAGISDFWRRWHISLSSWLRDYLYFPLGGSRTAPWHAHVNLLVVMLLGGLWHGASWMFVIWGAWHGVLLVVDKVGAPLWGRLPGWLYRGATFVLVVLGWVFFRATSLPMALTWLARLFDVSRLRWDVPLPLALLCLGGLLAVNGVAEPWQWRLPEHRRWAVAYAVALFLMYLVINWQPTVFLYYQF